jgi:hypothetical protein
MLKNIVTNIVTNLYKNSDTQGFCPKRAYVIVEAIKMQNLMTELQQLYLRHDEITEDWEKIGYWIIERELLEQIVKKYETCPHKKYK